MSKTLDELMALVDDFGEEAVSASRKRMNLATAYRNELRTRLASLVADAERYQWLRFADDAQMKSLVTGDGWIPEGEEFDAAIDAARATQQTGEPQ